MATPGPYLMILTKWEKLLSCNFNLLSHNSDFLISFTGSLMHSEGHRSSIRHYKVIFTRTSLVIISVSPVDWSKIVLSIKRENLRFYQGLNVFVGELDLAHGLLFSVWVQRVKQTCIRSVNYWYSLKGLCDSLVTKTRSTAQTSVTIKC